MREIKFRVWDEINKAIRTDLAAIDFEKKTIYFINKENSITSDEHREFWYEPFTLMQYTGLKDKNGREIYEGDIIRIFNDELDEEDSWIDVVSFHMGGFFSDDEDLLGNVHFRAKVIGNIYENSDSKES